MPTEVSNAKYRLSKMGGSTEVILFAHGAWSTGDGKVFVPKGMVVHFYSVHGVFATKGVAIAESKIGGATDSAVSPAVLASLMTRKQAENWDNDRLDQEILLAKGDANAQGLGESMQIVESVQGRGLGNRQKVYNYRLAHDGPEPNDRRAEALFRTHGTSTAAIDLLIMQPDASGHLESAMSFARNEGEKYQVFHFLPCRHVDQNDAKSMRTVTTNLAGLGKGFTETSVL